MPTDEILRVAAALLPVLLFLAGLRLLDSYKLVPMRMVCGAITAGAIAAAICYQINTYVFTHFPQYQDQYPRFGSPLVEETVKSVFWIFLISTARVAFMVDSAI